MRVIAGDFPLGPVLIRGPTPVAGSQKYPPTAIVFPKRGSGFETVKVFRIKAVAVGVRLRPEKWLGTRTRTGLAPTMRLQGEGCAAEIILFDGRMALVLGSREDLEALDGQVQMWRMVGFDNQVR